MAIGENCVVWVSLLVQDKSELTSARRQSQQLEPISSLSALELFENIMDRILWCIYAYTESKNVTSSLKESGKISPVCLQVTLILLGKHDVHNHRKVRSTIRVQIM